MKKIKNKSGKIKKGGSGRNITIKYPNRNNSSTLTTGELIINFILMKVLNYETKKGSDDPSNLLVDKKNLDYRTVLKTMYELSTSNINLYKKLLAKMMNKENIDDADKEYLKGLIQDYRFHV